MKHLLSKMLPRATNANNPLNRHSSGGWSRGFAQHAVRLRNGWLMQKPARPARGNPVKVNYAVSIFKALMSIFITKCISAIRFIATKLSMSLAWIPASAGMTKFVSLSENLAAIQNLASFKNLTAFKNKCLLFTLALFSPFAHGIESTTQGAVSSEYRWLTFIVFSSIIAATMYITWRASKRVKSTEDFYAAGNSISGLQNGWAIAGDYLSAASFLGIAGLISLYGYDGFMYSVGFLMGYIAVLLVIAEPCRNIGKYTLGDILAFRNDPKKSAHYCGNFYDNSFNFLPHRANGRRRRAG